MKPKLGLYTSEAAEWRRSTSSQLAILAVLGGSVYAGPRQNAAASEAIDQAQAVSLNGTAAEWRPRRDRDDGGHDHGGPKLSRVRICWEGKMHYTMLDLSDSWILSIDDPEMYAPKWNVMHVMALKAFLKNQIQMTESHWAHHANVHSQPVPWWKPLHSATACMLQERLEAEFAFEYKQIPEKKTTAESVYYKQYPSLPAIITPPIIAQFAQEIAGNEGAIKGALAQHAAHNLNHVQSYQCEAGLSVVGGTCHLGYAVC
ncbi:hypothetical protein HGRIS_011324 [Hohenbuehelia grisea]|uniref:Uncharacterized protein n=1 Tax=Hohenbuehelia grisea TaxID=104357 RepID=A0ABR3JWY3_9AGAR